MSSNLKHTDNKFRGSVVATEYPSHSRRFRASARVSDNRRRGSIHEPGSRKELVSIHGSDDEDEEEADAKIWNMTPLESGGNLVRVTSMSHLNASSRSHWESSDNFDGSSSSSHSEDSSSLKLDGEIVGNVLTHECAKSDSLGSVDIDQFDRGHVDSDHDLESSDNALKNDTEEPVNKLNSEVSAPPEVVNMPEVVWQEMTSLTAMAFSQCFNIEICNSFQLFEKACAQFGNMQLHPRRDPDVLSDQLIKDIKRETVEVNDETFEAADHFDSLYTELERIVLENQPDLSGTPLELKVQRILRSCSRTVSGFDAYDVVSALFSETRSPKALVTPTMMNNSPICIFSEQGTLTLRSVNIFKVSSELDDGHLVPVILLRTEIVEQIEMSNWQTVRWMNITPMDKAMDCLNAINLFRDRFISTLLKKTSKKDNEFNKLLFDFVTKYRTSLDKALQSSAKSVKQLVEAEYRRGFQDATAKYTEEKMIAEAQEDRGDEESPDLSSKARRAISMFRSFVNK